MIHFQFPNQYNKFICISIKINKYDEPSIERLMINGTTYSKKQIKTQYRNDVLISYAEKHGLELQQSIEEIF